MKFTAFLFKTFPQHIIDHIRTQKEENGTNQDTKKYIFLLTYVFLFGSNILFFCSSILNVEFAKKINQFRLTKQTAAFMAHWHIDTLTH